MKEYKFQHMLLRDGKVVRSTVFSLREQKPMYALIDGMTEVFRQFTGVRDKNGREIYEGDIIVAKTYPFYGDDSCENELNYVGEVVWFEEDLKWCYNLHVVSDRVRGAACGDSLARFDGWEVIGDIYSNPDLLK